MIRGFENISREQSQQLLNWFFHRATVEQRRALAGALPQAYNAWVGADVATVSINGEVLA